MLLQEHEGRIAALTTRLSQQGSAAGDQQEPSDDVLQRLSKTTCEASDLHQVDILESSPMVCCDTSHLTPVHLHTDIKQKMLSLLDFDSAPILHGPEAMLSLYDVQ